MQLHKDAFSSSKGIFCDVYKGNLTDIVKRFNRRAAEDASDPSGASQQQSQNEIKQLLIERDTKGRTPLDLACFLGYKNIAIYLMSKMGTPQDVIM